MIKIEDLCYNSTSFVMAIQGMRNPMNSWAKSDSGWGNDWPSDHGILIDSDADSYYECRIGPNDQELMRKLAKAGSVHAKYRRMITVYADITAPLYWWKEFDTYKVGTVANSCSTMHKIHAKEFMLEDFSCEHLFTCPDRDKCPEFVYNVERNRTAMEEEVLWHYENGASYAGEAWDEINDWVDYEYAKDVLEHTITVLNYYRQKFLETNDKRYWWQMIQLLPSSYNQKRTVMLNYEVLAHMYHDRKDHKLDEWRIFCEIMKDQLPLSEIFTLSAKED